MSCPARLLLAGHMLSKVCAMWTGFSFHFFLPSLLDLIMPWCWLHGLLNFFWLRNISLSCVPLPRRWTLGMFPNAWSYVADWVASPSSGTWTTSTHRWYTLQAVLVLLLSSLSPCLFLIPLWCWKIFGYKDAVLVLLLSSLSPCLFLIPLWCCKIFGYKDAVLVLLLSSLSPCLFLIPLWCCKTLWYKDAVLVLLLSSLFPCPCF